MKKRIQFVDSNKKIHGWWPGKRECTSERFLLNPYNGCQVDCLFCYTKGFPGYFQEFRKNGTVTIFRNFDKFISHQLDSLCVASCGYLSPVTDPFQPLENIYHISERIIIEFLSRNIPIEIITKCKIPERILERIADQVHSFIQFSILTPSEEKRKRLMKGGGTTEEIFKEIEKTSKRGIFTVCRIDPIIPFMTDNLVDIEEIVNRASDSGAGHIVVSVLDIPIRIADEVFIKLCSFAPSLRTMYTECIGGYLHAKTSYRRKVFDAIRKYCEKKKITFALCMEYEIRDGIIHGLNREYMTSESCEGINIPVYLRRGNHFEPASSCSGTCLYCVSANCGVEDLALGRIVGIEKPGFIFSDYKRWSKELKRQINFLS